MSTLTTVRGAPVETSQSAAPPCVLVIFGASGDLTKRLLMPALFNLWCDRLLPENLAIQGVALDQWSTEEFRSRMTADIHQFNTRSKFDEAAWASFVGRMYYLPGKFDDPKAYQQLGRQIGQLDGQYQTAGNVLFYLAIPPALFGMVSDNLFEEKLIKRAKGWSRIIVEKPFGHDLASGIALNQEMLRHWSEDQIYRIDHYLGKEAVQNLLAFRFSNGIFEPLWNKDHIDHIQFSVTETVGVEGRGKYYETAGVLRDMIQNHMFQMLAYLCMEPPASFHADATRNEKAKLLESVRIMTPADVARDAVRGQYGAGKKDDGSPAVGYRQEPDVSPTSTTETFAAVKLWIDNWRWEGVPVYLRSGKNLWKRGTEIAVQFKKAPPVIFRGTDAAGGLESNKLLFHIQPDQGIELRFHAKSPGPTMNLQKVDMRFDYRESFEAARGTGYEVLVYNAICGDATLFSRSDLVEVAWRIAQPILDTWAKTPVDFPNYPAGSWGPTSSFDLIERDGRNWLEVFNRTALEKVPLFQGIDPVWLHNIAMMLQPGVASAGQVIARQGEEGKEMYFICRGQVEVLNASGARLATLGEGDFFGELSLLLSEPRNATVRAITPCDLFVLDKADFLRVLRMEPKIDAAIRASVKQRYSAMQGAIEASKGPG